MTRNENILQIKPPPASEEEMRRDNIFFRMDFGTPWDHEGHFIHLTGSVTRADFIMQGPGALADAVTEMVVQVEAYIRAELIPAAIALEEKRQWDAAHQEPADKV
jgi:hypothetical protein